MTLKECTAILTPLALALRAEMDAPTYRAYHRALDDVPLPLLEAAVNQAMRVNSAFMPKPGELRAMAEVRRRELMAAHPYERCADCNHTGTVRLLSADWERGLPPKYGKCKCWHTYQKRLEALGISHEPLALPAGVEE
jgi:hypothetical protein